MHSSDYVAALGGVSCGQERARNVGEMNGAIASTNAPTAIITTKTFRKHWITWKMANWPTTCGTARDRVGAEREPGWRVAWARHR